MIYFLLIGKTKLFFKDLIIYFVKHNMLIIFDLALGKTTLLHLY